MPSSFSALFPAAAPVPGSIGFGCSCRLFSGRIRLGRDPWVSGDLACETAQAKDLWSAIDEAKEASVVFVDSECGSLPTYCHLSSWCWGTVFLLFWTLGGAGAWQTATTPLRPRYGKVSDLGFGRRLSLRLNPVLAEPERRLQLRPFRHFVASAPAGTVLSQEGFMTLDYLTPTSTVPVTESSLVEGFGGALA